MKKFLIILLVFLAVVAAAIITVPILFKDDIVAAIDSKISENINADVYFDANKIGVSLLRHFPDITLTLKDFGIVGKETFEGDTLASVEAFDLTVDIISLITGEQITLKTLNMISPRVMILVNEDGKANYDILMKKEGEEEKIDAVEEGALSISIDSWQINNGILIYYDFSDNLLMALDGINHSGSGDFSKDVFDIVTSTIIERMMVSYEDVEYLKNKRLEANIVLNADLPNQIYTFRQNTFSLNDFNFGFEGSIEMPDEQYDLSLSFYGNDNSVKNILSLIPAVYNDNFQDIEAEGVLDFEGILKGTLNGDQEKYPSFNIQMSTKNGMIKYPDLPEAISNIHFDLNVGNSTGEYEKTEIELKQLHMDLGKNPVDVSIKVKDLIDYEVDGIIKTNLDLKDLLSLYPLDSTEMSGNMQLDLTVHGAYDTTTHTIPINGNVHIRDLFYKSPDLKHGLKIKSSDVTLSTEKIDIEQFKGSLGKSELILKGNLTNYIDYVFDEGAILKGNFDFSSAIVDINEWISTDGKTDMEEDTMEMEAIRVPRNLDVVLDSRIDKVLYDNLSLDSFKGQVVIRNGAIQFNKVDFNTLGGNFKLEGEYDTSDEELPEFDFVLKIKDLPFSESYRHFITIQKFAPIADIMEGNFSSDFRLAGKLKPNLMPDLTTLSGKGLIEIADAAIKGSQSKVISGITQLSKLSSESTNVGLSDVILKSQINDGRVFTQPFNVKFGKNNALIAGNSGLDGSLDYNVKLDVPPQLIQNAGSLLSSLTGKEINANSKDVKMNFKIGGNFDEPKISILGIESGESKKAAEEAMKVVVEEEKEKVLNEAEKLLDAEKENAPEEVQKVLEEHEEEIEKAKDKLRNFFKKNGDSN